MRFAYLIQAHDNAAQLAALTDRLSPVGGPDFAVIHIDAKSALWREAGSQCLPPRPEIHVVAGPVAVRWGHASQLAATRLLLDAALRRDFDVAHLLSGADWPLAPRATIAAEAGDTCWIDTNPGVQSDRMDRFRLDSRWLRPDPARPLEWYPARALRHASALLPARRRQLWGPWHKGSQWWSLPRDVCASVLAGLEQGFASGRFAGTVCADEHAIQTMVARRYPNRLASHPLPHRRFIRWDEGRASPAVLSVADWPQAQASGAWFARKLSTAHDPFFLTQPEI